MEFLYIIFKGIDISFGNYRKINTFFICLIYYFIFYISYILNKINLIPDILQVVSYHVKYDYRSGITYGNVIIDSRTTDIDSGFVSRHWFKILFFSIERII